MEGRTTHIIALFEMDGARAAVLYGSEGNIADCFDNAVAWWLTVKRRCTMAARRMYSRTQQHRGA